VTRLRSERLLQFDVVDTATADSLFKCAPDRSGRDKCVADASATMKREDWGVAFGKNFGVDMKVVLPAAAHADQTRASSSSIA